MALSTLSNYHNGTSLSLAGVNGTDYFIEKLCWDPRYNDRSLVRLRSDTEFSFSLNERNTMRVSGSKYSVVGIAGGGVIRYRVDGDLYWGPRWSHAGGVYTNLNPVYSAPLKFSTLTYPAAQGSIPVKGAIGHNGASFATKAGRFYYGQQDSAGNEYHAICTGHDDWNLTTTGDEYRCSDGRMWLFCPDPVTAGFQPQHTGDAQWITTPFKVYFNPKINSPTTYFHLNTGTVSFLLKDLYGANIYYRVGGVGPFTASGASEVTLPSSLFADGENTLEWYSEGNSAHVERRTLVKNPPWPSESETHGLLCCGSPVNKARMLVSSATQPMKAYWDNLKQGKGDAGGRTAWDTETTVDGLREYTWDALSNAMVPYLEGNVAAVPTGKSKTFAAYAKEMLLRNYRAVDMVGWEIDWAGTQHPSREFVDRGYNSVKFPNNLALAYDTLISFFRSDMATGGITPIEDIHIRESIAADVFESMMIFANYQGNYIQLNTNGMWQTARKMGAVNGMFAIPSYSSGHYGTNGLDGNTTTHPMCPFIDDEYTWKQCFLDEDRPLAGYPNLSNRLGIENDNIIVVPRTQPNTLSYGDWYDRVAYLPQLGPHICSIVNLFRWLYPDKASPVVREWFYRCASGQVMGGKSEPGSGGYRGPTTWIFPGYVNAGWGAAADIAKGVLEFPYANPKNPNSEKEQLNGRMPFILRDYDDTYVAGSGTPETGPLFTTQPASATRTAGESVTFTVALTGNPIPTRQWRKNGANISGQTGLTYTIASTVTGDAGVYDCVATNSVASVTSAQATLTVNAETPTPGPVTKRQNFRSPAVATLV